MKRLWDKVLASVLYPFFRPYVGMPGRSYRGPLPELTDDDKLTRTHLVRHVRMLAEKIGDRSVLNMPGLNQAADYIGEEFLAAGYSGFDEQPFNYEGYDLRNLEVRVEGTELPNEVLVVGAHYDTVPGTPGADDNATGVAAMLHLARRFAFHPCRRSLRFVGFAREETKVTNNMGSYDYAKRCHGPRREDRRHAQFGDDGRL